ncbi:putative adhesin [Pluralibacter sp.]|uniref:putative adhesin n=1 Tax=Pluralibacter sp. TaxID=1920032 RepID=UPI00345D1AC7
MAGGQKIIYFTSNGQALEDPGTENIAMNLFLPRETLNGPGKVQNYNLSSYKLDTPEDIRQIADDSDADVISVTERTDLKHILKRLNQVGLKYKTIEGLFCRSRFKDAVLSKLHLRDAPTQNAYADPFAYYKKKNP